MSLTALAFLVAFTGGLAFSFYRPLWGLGVYVLTFYCNPASSWWGQDLPDLRWSMTAAVVTLVASVVVGPTPLKSSDANHLDATPSPQRPRFDTAAVFLAIFAGWSWVESLWAIDAERHFIGALLLTKFVVLYFLVKRLVRSERELQFFALAQVLGAFTWGWTGFRTDVQGRFEPMLGPGMSDANAIGFQMVVAAAFAGFMFISAGGWQRWAAFAALPFLLNTIILTASRSALVAMLAAGLAAIWFAPRERRRFVYISAGLGLVLFLMLAGSDLFWDRAATLTETNVEEMEGSAASRLTIARANWAMFVDYPLGAGYGGTLVLSPRYIPPELLSADAGFRSAHNTFLAVLVDGGVPAFLSFGVCLLVGLVSLWRLKSQPHRSTILGSYQAAVFAGLCAFIVSSQFINLLSAETWVWLLALAQVLAGLTPAVAVHSPEKTRSFQRERIPA